MIQSVSNVSFGGALHPSRAQIRAAKHNRFHAHGIGTTPAAQETANLGAQATAPTAAPAFKLLGEEKPKRGILARLFGKKS